MTIIQQRCTPYAKCRKLTQQSMANRWAKIKKTRFFSHQSLPHEFSLQFYCTIDFQAKWTRNELHSNRVIEFYHRAIYTPYIFIQHFSNRLKTLISTSIWNNFAFFFFLLLLSKSDLMWHFGISIAVFSGFLPII